MKLFDIPMVQNLILTRLLTTLIMRHGLTGCRATIVSVKHTSREVVTKWSNLVLSIYHNYGASYC